MHLLHEKEILNALDALSGLVGGVSIKFFKADTLTPYRNVQCFDSPFCSALQGYPQFNMLCINCDQQAFERARALKGQYEYKCHLGLNEILLPVFTEDDYVGFFSFGQFLYADENIEAIWNAARQKLSKLHIPAETVANDFWNLKRIGRKEAEDMKAMLHFFAFSVSLSGVIKPSVPTAFEDVDAYIAENLGRKITLRGMAERLHLNPSYLSAMFSRKRGTTLFKHIQETRIKVACRILRTTDDSISSVAEAVGFRDQRYFGKLFKQVMGVPPGTYRKNWRRIDGMDGAVQTNERPVLNFH